MTQQICLSIPEESLSDIKLTPEQLSAEIPLVAAIKFYEIGKLSAGAAASLAGITKVVFLSKLGDYGVNTFQLNEAELMEDFANA